MSKYREIFPKKHTLLVVIHCEDEDQTLRNAQIANEEGADGVFLINHNIPVNKLLKCYRVTKLKYPNWFVGLNILGARGMSALMTIDQINPSPSGIWLDDIGFDEIDWDPCDHLKLLRKYQRKHLEPNLLLFGSIAFKYQTPIVNPAKAAYQVSPFVDVVTTSGEATGIVTDLSKVIAMKKSIGNTPLAIASGVSVDNVHGYLPYVDCFLVATRISYSNTELDPSKVSQLVKAIA